MGLIFGRAYIWNFMEFEKTSNLLFCHYKYPTQTTSERHEQNILSQDFYSENSWKVLGFLSLESSLKCYTDRLKTEVKISSLFFKYVQIIIYNNYCIDHVE